MKAKVRLTNEIVNVIIGSVDTNTAGKLVFIYFEEGNTTGRSWSEEELKFEEE